MGFPCECMRGRNDLGLICEIRITGRQVLLTQLFVIPPKALQSLWLAMRTFMNLRESGCVPGRAAKSVADFAF